MDYIPLQKYIDICLDADILDVLPLVHTQTIRTVKENYQDELKPFEKCDIFDKWLTYFYYGVPLYCPKIEFTKMETFPVCFLMSPDVILQNSKAYPMDTGAFHGQPLGKGDEMTAFFEKLNLSPKDAVGLYELICSHDNIRRYIILFFGNNNKYFSSICNIGVEDTINDNFVDNSVFQCFYDMLRTELEKLDNRCKLVEILSECSYSIKNNVRMVIWPREQMSEYYYMRWNLDIQPIEYDNSFLLDDKSFVENIYNETQKYLSIKEC